MAQYEGLGRRVFFASSPPLPLHFFFILAFFVLQSRTDGALNNMGDNNDARMAPERERERERVSLAALQ